MPLAVYVTNVQFQLLATLDLKCCSRYLVEFEATLVFALLLPRLNLQIVSPIGTPSVTRDLFTIQPGACSTSWQTGRVFRFCSGERAVTYARSDALCRCGVCRVLREGRNLTFIAPDQRFTCTGGTFSTTSFRSALDSSVSVTKNGCRSGLNRAWRGRPNDRFWAESGSSPEHVSPGFLYRTLLFCVRLYCSSTAAPADIDVIQIFPICRSIALSARSLRSL